MSNIWIVSPILFQLASAVTLLFFWSNTKIQKTLSILLSLINLGIVVTLFTLVLQNGIQVTQAGNWQAPFGITFVADA
ncbi:MAG: Na+/H+ antiporter subunit D, partial [Cyclobacteriaceae bacterium]|nr:Na+/H+ antiporter subunit D [Cyclobacteriaceae bacterium]